MIDHAWIQLTGLGSDYLVSQFFAAVSLALIIVGFLQQSDTRFKWYLLVSCVTLAPHFYFLDAWAGFFTNLVVLARYGVALRWPGSRAAFVVLVATGTALGLWYFRDARDVLVIAANILGCVAVFLNKGRAMRMWFLPTTVCWLTFNALNLSVFGVAFESFCLASNLVGIRRMRRELPAATPSPSSTESESRSLFEPGISYGGRFTSCEGGRDGVGTSGRE
jgi:Bacterial inner membrane protein